MTAAVFPPFPYLRKASPDPPPWWATGGVTEISLKDSARLSYGLGVRQGRLLLFPLLHLAAHLLLLHPLLELGHSQGAE